MRTWLEFSNNVKILGGNVPCPIAIDGHEQNTEHSHFLTISSLRCGGKFCDGYMWYFLRNLPVKKLVNFTKLWWKDCVGVFMTCCVHSKYHLHLWTENNRETRVCLTHITMRQQPQPFYHYFTAMTESTIRTHNVGDQSHIQASVAQHSSHILFDRVL